MTKRTAPSTAEELSSVGNMSTEKLKRIVELLIQLDNDRIKAEAEEKAKEEELKQ